MEIAVQEYIEFETNDGIRKVALDRLVLKVSSCSQQGASYHALTMGALESNPQNATLLAPISKLRFDELRGKHPSLPLLRREMD
ncbi:hypothetical protein BM525_19795 (plasmid) [Alteromonas mediterranea]|uniref:Uncharacterized protein n=1 Tax=Alteromonas mediterranea TaxID=314275 RepID=A0AAC9JHY7_9ALTE|nr:hypothetical protein BM524_19600 [Alteromonas mediterranea]APD99982.1 hypothetical protein BM525_19795 [Alteromonas mediterranea]